MKYSKPEIEIIEINAVDVIATSGDPNPGENGGPMVPFSMRNSTETGTDYWTK